MRELTKSVVCLAWWSGIAGMRQVLASDELRATLEAVGQAGDTVQRGVVDLLFSALTLNIADADMWTAR